MGAEIVPEHAVVHREALFAPHFLGDVLEDERVAGVGVTGVGQRRRTDTEGVWMAVTLEREPPVRVYVDDCSRNNLDRSGNPVRVRDEHPGCPGPRLPSARPRLVAGWNSNISLQARA